MGFKRIVTETQRQQGKKAKDTKNKHKSKSWATLNTNAKFEILGDMLVDLGYIQA